MKKTTRITHLLTTNCTIVEAEADILTIHSIFHHFPNQFLPVVKGLQFVGVILKHEFMQHLAFEDSHDLLAEDLISKEMVKLGPHNTLAEAKTVFDTRVFNMIPVVDEEGDLVGVLFREVVEAAWRDADLDPKGNRNTFHKLLSFLSL